MTIPVHPAALDSARRRLAAKRLVVQLLELTDFEDMIAVQRQMPTTVAEMADVVVASIVSCHNLIAELALLRGRQPRHLIAELRRELEAEAGQLADRDVEDRIAAAERQRRPDDDELDDDDEPDDATMRP